jgi:hypothetical protein
MTYVFELSQVLHPNNFQQPPNLTFHQLCSRVPVSAQIREKPGRMAKGWKVAQDQAMSQHRLHHHGDPKMPADLLHNMLCIKHGSRRIRVKRLKRWEGRIRTNRRGNTSCVFVPTQK